jgi:anti-sigma regulatory factor (Ser/Thr protein kinase)
MSSMPTMWHLSVPGGLDAAARVRHALEANLNGELSAERRFDACLLVHELVVNSVLHAGADPSQTIDVEMTIDADAVRVAVSDNGSVSVPSVQRPDAEREGGRGLRLVELLSDVWGMRREGTRGTTLWFELRRDGPHPT